MTPPVASTLTVGTGPEARDIAILKRGGRAPGIVWLGGFKSDMTGTKAAALDTWALETGRAFTRFDYSGHGASGGRFDDGTISRWLEESLAVFERETAGDQILVGSSMGGWIALLLARAERAKAGAASRVRGMVLIAPAPDFTERLMWARFPEAVRAEILDKGVWSQPSPYADEPYRITRALIEDGRRNLLMDGPIETGCPVTILQGVKDEDVPWRHAVDLVTCLARDDVVLTLVKDGDHRLSRPEDLKRLLDAVEALATGAEGLPSPAERLP
ncbi:alpha/beta hydrolase [Prosthecomicrobium sp. N25]|uniref:alpha/beta hydrolase n=1 Tax=Prosthecomicrobium sp. N25 TaxID=3129254 RepID=UPI0030775F21